MGKMSSVRPNRFWNHHFNISDVTPLMSSCSIGTRIRPRGETVISVHLAGETGLKARVHAASNTARAAIVPRSRFEGQAFYE